MTGPFFTVRSKNSSMRRQRIAQHDVAAEEVDLARIDLRLERLAELDQHVEQPQRIGERDVASLVPCRISSGRSSLSMCRIGAEMCRSRDSARRSQPRRRVARAVRRPVDDARDVDAGAPQRRVGGHRLQRQESAVTQAEHADAVGIDVAERLEVIRAGRNIAVSLTPRPIWTPVDQSRLKPELPR